ncbi:hypothetical protein ACIQNG_23285 [Streptomyces sp. NPDC091377]
MVDAVLADFRDFRHDGATAVTFSRPGVRAGAGGTSRRNGR